MKGFNYYNELFKKYLEGSGYKEITIRNMVRGVSLLRDFLSSKKIYNVYSVTKHEIEEFYRYLKNSKKRDGKPLSSKTISHNISYVNQFYRYLLRHELVVVNPCENAIIDLKLREKRREVFTKEEICRFLDNININIDVDLRERALLELLYSSGLRASEILNLKLNDINFSERQLVVKGKGDKDRFVPFSEVSRKFLRMYIDTVRRDFVKHVSCEYKEYLFLTKLGSLSASQLNRRFRRLLKEADLAGKNLTLHSIRHSTATHLLEAGASVRYVQELLGHENLCTTVRYTYLMLDSLRKKYKVYHPRENDYFYEIGDDYFNGLNSFKSHLVKAKKKNDSERERRKRAKE